MEFRLLGPLEVEDTTGPVALGGTRQRAVLAVLLLHANQVVPTSQLLDALWPTDRVPLTARKILQNAVWRLRRTLDLFPGGPDAPELLTRTPGYMVRVPADLVDLLRFQRMTARGRAAFSAGDAGNARQVLREALDLWRGPALADLAEEGTVWPELAALEMKRLDITEDLFEAELVCGRHQSLLRELEAFVESEPLRERASQQLMLALYRCGRQADALGVYARVRAALVEGLGLEPGRQMQLLQQSILAQDPGLDLDLPSAEPYRETVEARQPVAPPAPEPAAGPVDDDHADAYQPSSVLMLRFGLGPEFDDLPPGDFDRVLDTVCQLARDEIAKSGGRAAASIGSVLLGLFEQDPDLPDSAERAVRAGSLVRDCLSITTGPLAPPAPAIRGLAVHAAVATGTAVVCHWPAPGGGAVQPWIGGDLVDLCEAMLAQAPPGEVHVCDETRRRTESAITYHRVCTYPAKWQVRTVGQDPDGAERRAAPGAERECELELMTGLLGRTRLRSTPHLVTVLGDSSLGKTRLLMEFQRRVADAGPDTVHVLTGTVPDPGDALSAPAEMLAAYCGIAEQDTTEAALGKVAAAVERLTGEGPADDPGTVLSLLGPLVTTPAPAHAADDLPHVLTAWRHFVAKAARAHPLVLIWDDLHQADDTLLEAVEQLCTDCVGAPLLNVVGAHIRLLTRRPEWSGGLQQAMTLRLAPVAGDALDRMLQSLFTPDGNMA